jgi:hypothetical protein
MQNKTEIWSEKWEALKINKNTNSGKFLAICTLLTLYSKSDHSGNYGMFFRALYGNWNTSHGNAVAVALQRAGKYSEQEEDNPLANELLENKYEQKIQGLMKELAFQIGNQEIKQGGDFEGVLATIENKTGYSIRNYQIGNINGKEHGI